MIDNKRWQNFDEDERTWEPLGQLYDDVKVMVEKYGDDDTKWPQPGCGARFKPWHRGASKVIEMRDAEGEWHAISSRPKVTIENKNVRCFVDTF